MMEIREFTKEDWYAWAGAEEFRDGAPLIAEVTMIGGVEFTAIADAVGIEIHVFSPADDDDMAWRLEAKNSKKRQRALLEAVLDELNISPESYAADVSYGLDHADGFEPI